MEKAYYEYCGETVCRESRRIIPDLPEAKRKDGGK
jgi:hypothetical protein